MLSHLVTIFQNEIRIHLRQAYNWITPLLFFTLIIMLFAMLVTNEFQMLNSIAIIILWFSVLLSVLTSLDNLFKQDVADGILDLLLLSSLPLTLIILCKVMSHWLMYCLPLILLTPFFCLLLDLNLHQTLFLIASLLIGSPSMILIGSIGAALVNGIRGQGLLLPILIMPLYIPILIFGIGCAIQSSVIPNSYANLGSLAFLGAYLLVAIVGAPILAAISLRIGVNQ